MPPRHQILGCTLNGPPSQFAETYKEDFIGVGNYPKGRNPYQSRKDDIHTSLGMMALHHLGYDIPVKPREFLNRGVDVVVDFFSDDWWKADEYARKYMDKRRNSKDMEWYDAFSDGLLLCLLSERWSDVAKVCSWVEAKLNRGTVHEDVESEVVDLYKSVAAGLRPEPMPGVEKLEAKIMKCRTQRPKLLFQAWDAARKKDQAAFDKAFVKSLEHFAANYGTGPIAEDWIAKHPSVVGLAARRLGVKWPKLPLELEVLLITPESLRGSRDVKGRVGKEAKARGKARLAEAAKSTLVDFFKALEAEVVPPPPVNPRAVEFALAARDGDLDKVRRMLKAGVDVNEAAEVPPHPVNTRHIRPLSAARSGGGAWSLRGRRGVAEGGGRPECP